MPAAPEPLRLRSTRSYRHLAPPVSPRHTLAALPAERDACNPLCINSFLLLKAARRRLSYPRSQTGRDYHEHNRRILFAPPFAATSFEESSIDRPVRPYRGKPAAFHEPPGQSQTTKRARRGGPARGGADPRKRGSSRA